MANQSQSKTSELVSKISDSINNSIIKKTEIFSKKSDGYWDQFFAAVDTIKDTCLAIEYFQITSNSWFLENPYLATYGLLQALFIQQDAVNHLKTSLFGEKDRILWKDVSPELDQIRKLRNETIGHPARTELKRGSSRYQEGEITFCTIDRSSLSKDGFEYILWTHLKNEHKHIKFKEIVTLQDTCLSKELQAIFDKIQEEEKKHRAKFKGEKLEILLADSTLYTIQLIYGVQWNDHLGWSSFDHYLGQYKKVRAGLEDRYGKFGSATRIHGTEEVIKKLDYIFGKLETFKATGKFEEYEFEVYVDALNVSLGELKSHLAEIDREFQL